MKRTFQILWGVLSLVLLPVTSFAQVDTCATAIGDTSQIQFLVEAQLEPCATLLEIGTIADSTRPSGQGGWAIKAAFLTCAAQVDSATFFVAQCPSAFAIESLELNATTEKGMVKFSLATVGEDGTDQFVPEYLGSGGDVWYAAHDTIHNSRGSGDHNYTMWWRPRASGIFYVRVKATDINGNVSYSKVSRVGVEVERQLQIRGNHPGSAEAQIYSEHADVQVANLPVYDQRGTEIGRTDTEGYLPNLPSGLYHIPNLSTMIIR